MINLPPTKAGWVVESIDLHYDGDASASKSFSNAGMVTAGLDATSDAFIVGGLYTFETPVLESHFSMGAFLPYIWMDVTADVVAGGTAGTRTDTTDGIKGRENYLVVQIAYADAAAYAKWAGKLLPTEAEWEFAARGGKAGDLYTWGNELTPGGKFQANIYQGEFPVAGGDTGEDGFKGIAPVAQYAPNSYGLYDVAGNVWEWCSDWYRVDTYARRKLAGGIERNPQGPSTPYDPAEPNEKKRVHRGGSFLCVDQYCARYMVGTRGKGEERTASNHVGFRCVQN